MPVQTRELRGGFEVSRIARGNWQLAEDHSNRHVDNDTLVEDMSAFALAGVTTFVCGDIYAGVEERIGIFRDRYRARYGEEAAKHLKVMTTYVPAFLDRDGLRRHDRKSCEAVIDRSLRRLRQERLDLVQMCWWDYSIPGNLDMALMLKDLQRAGKIHLLGATNYDVPHMREMFEAGIDIATHTVQYSVLDRRPRNGMVDLCARHACQLVCYGVLGGGLISERWLGVPDPGKPAFENVSLDKYYRIVRDFGGWSLLQELLRTLATIARRHRASIANIACRYVLDQPQVGVTILGARDRTHLEDNLRVFSITFDTADYRAIDAVLSKSLGPKGDCYGLDRDEDRDAQEELKAQYVEVEAGKLIWKSRIPATPGEPYGHHLKSKE